MIRILDTTHMHTGIERSHFWALPGVLYRFSWGFQVLYPHIVKIDSS